MINPTGKGIRIDPAGNGSFGAPRGSRLHDGEDYLCDPGQDVKACISGRLHRIVYPYGDDLSWKGVEIVNDAWLCKMLYLDPDESLIGKQVKADQVIGSAQDISQRYEGQDMEPHIHVRLSARLSLFI